MAAFLRVKRITIMSTPFILTVTGESTIPHPAERALLNISVETSGPNKASVSDSVLTTAKHLESLLRSLSPASESDEDKAASPLAHWSKTGLTATSHIPYKDDGTAEPRQFDGSITFDIRFKDFAALGAFGEKLSALPHVEVKGVHWILTPATEKSFRSRLRREAAQDALEKAKDYAEVLGCFDVRAVELTEGGEGMSGMGRATQSLGPRTRQLARKGGRDESPLEFQPEEVRMGMEVEVKFHAT
ncbi:uncharacterized protein LTR77_009555 [Saxophila tyrrhenica]|uniref:DUF541 domain-containing protein n=1 Tax=Saxophila tyrrhenica TaxID=1690608 RepID=A0AAV9NZS7_9PEZI|nr:hypothetical protein LTR77_009555 [Saxophila tyrrhenica]